MDDLKKLTIEDIAHALGLSKTTVSRSISGKGRISKETVERVMHYIKEHDFQPNVIAKSLAQSNTFNIAFVIPKDPNLSELPFFQNCLLGVCEVANASGYDVIVITAPEDDISELSRVISNNKVSGVILSRSLEKDFKIDYLKSKKMPFVLIGHTNVQNVIQIDNDHNYACFEFTSVIIKKGIKRPGIIGGDIGHVVNNRRLNGYLKALQENGISEKNKHIYLNANTKPMIQKAVSELFASEVDCIFCLDDMICCNVLYQLDMDEITIPNEIKIASFYNSLFLENHIPSISTLNFDVKNLGGIACETMINILQGINQPEKKLLGYEIILKESTKF